MVTIQAAKAPILFTNYAKIGFTIGKITNAEEFPKARNPSYKVSVDFNRRQLSSSAQLPPNYPIINELYNRTVVSVINLGARKIAGFKSECLIVGFPDDNGHVHLLNTRGRNVTPGLSLDMNSNPPTLIAYEDFANADIRAAEITSITEMESAPNNYLATVNLGSLGERKVSILDIDPTIATEVNGSQVAVVINIKKECFTDPDTYVLTFTDQGKKIPLGIDHPVSNGVNLF